MMPPVKLLHISPWIKTTGGVETLLARHAVADRAQGFESWQVSLFDKTPPRPGETYSTQLFSWKSTPREMRTRMVDTCAAHPDCITVWQNAWGLPWFGDGDGSVRRIACLQDSEMHFGPLLPGLAGLVDGVTCLSEAAARTIRPGLPGLEADRVVVLPLPIAPPPGLSGVRPPRREWVIGCAGRLVRTQKRWDRLVPFVAELKRLGVPFRLDVASDGPLRGWLERRLGGDPAVQFTGWKKGDAYWERLQQWDAAVFFSDHEGGPIVLLEVMAAGVLPLYPRIGGSLGDDYAARIDPRCYYPAGDAPAAARALQAIMASPPAEVAGMRRRAQELATPYTGEAYDSAFAAFARRIADRPRISREPRGERISRLTDHLPLGLLTRMLPATLLR